MQFNQATDYAFRAMLHLAARPPGSIVSIQQLAASEAIPPRFLQKITRPLGKAGLIRSHRGVEGGFALARPAEEISLLDIITAVEGKLVVHRCLAEREACNKHCTEECPVHATLARLQAQLVAGLRQANLAALVAEQRGRK
ncbi:RrF2 family transcriptional regulator [Anaeroselena agilis]|uniref:Rrf2 family transcriptional regulator n=1 Tax=Anaeroselena agilis TaxID=3063788 RepID=A0ABU3NUI1_9FIRM|nr:Rrf2 family transcriptional regulator [Selenomonadales bacterium 4137-cl]